MSRRLVTIYSIDRIPRTAGARRELGYGPTTFEIVADSEGEAVGAAMNRSRWDRNAFAWKLTGSRVEVIDSD